MWWIVARESRRSIRWSCRYFEAGDVGVNKAQTGGTVGIVGLGYVGLPLAVAFAEAGYRVVAVDMDASKIAALSQSRSYIEDIASERLAAVSSLIHPTTRY